MYTAPPLPDDSQRDEGERNTLALMLDYYRAVLIRKGAGLDAEQLATTLPPSDLTIGGLLKHMAYVEDYWFNAVLIGAEPAEPWASVDWSADADWDHHSAADDTPRELLNLLTDSIQRSRSVAADLTLDDQLRGVTHSPPINLRWLFVHMIEEYARHCGHADMIREAIDGQVGD